MEYKALIRLIINHRNARGITQSEVARMIGISQVSYSRIESGKRKPSISVFFKLLKYYEIKLVYSRFKSPSTQFIPKENADLINEMIIRVDKLYKQHIQNTKDKIID